MSDSAVAERLYECDDERIFIIYQALKRGVADVDRIHEITMIDEWFLYKIFNIIKMEKTSSDRTPDGSVISGGEKMAFRIK